MNAETEQLLLQLVQETRTDVKDLLQRVSRLESAPVKAEPKPTGAVTVASGLGGGAAIVGLVELLQRLGVLK